VHWSVVIHVANPCLDRYFRILYTSMSVTVCNFNASENFFLGAKGTGEGGGVGPLLLFNPI
jgi:hypothetical protein